MVQKILKISQILKRGHQMPGDRVEMLLRRELALVHVLVGVAGGSLLLVEVEMRIVGDDANDSCTTTFCDDVVGYKRTSSC